MKFADIFYELPQEARHEACRATLRVFPKLSIFLSSLASLTRLICFGRPHGGQSFTVAANCSAPSEDDRLQSVPKRPGGRSPLAVCGRCWWLMMSSSLASWVNSYPVCSASQSVSTNLPAPLSVAIWVCTSVTSDSSDTPKSKETHAGLPGNARPNTS